jgi:hypothetical protein
MPSLSSRSPEPQSAALAGSTEHLTTDCLFHGSKDWPPVRPNWSSLLHFPQIIWLAMKSFKPREWTELEVETLISMSGQRHSADEISKSLGRYVGSVKTKARQLGLVAVKKRPKRAGEARIDDC